MTYPLKINLINLVYKMNYSRKIILYLVALLLLFFIVASFVYLPVNEEKLNGVNFVSPSKETSFSNFEALKRINAEWVAFNPYAFSQAHKPSVNFDYAQSWWGEKTSGISEMIQQAKKENLKIMLKPHVWVIGQGWCGEYNLKTEDEWQIWENDYRKYIIAYAKIANQFESEILCIGTEYKIAATTRSKFWEQLIRDIRKIYKGKLVYAANWDNYENITFWNQLDYIGIDSYFPLSKTQNADKKELDEKWPLIVNKLKIFSKKHDKKILFTEYGYKSTNYTAWNQWEIEDIRSNEKINQIAQNNAYSSLYENIWNEDWFAGGFLWKMVC